MNVCIGNLFMNNFFNRSAIHERFQVAPCILVCVLDHLMYNAV